MYSFKTKETLTEYNMLKTPTKNETDKKKTVLFGLASA